MNYDILKKNFHPISSNPFHMGDWNTFLELSKSAKLIWRTGVGIKLDIIDLTTDSLEKLYVFTDEIPAEGIIDFIYPLETINFRTVDVHGNPNFEQINIITVNIIEIQLNKEIGVSFWKKVLDAMNNDENINGFKKEYNKRQPKIKHLSQRTFKEILKIVKEVDYAKLLVGRTFLLSLILGDSNTDSMTRQFVLYMFVDKDYFAKFIIEGLGLHCEQEK